MENKGNVLVVAYKIDNTLYPDGKPITVGYNSLVVGMNTIQVADYPTCDVTQLPTMELLQIVDDRFGPVWINQTIESWTTLSDVSTKTTNTYNICGTIGTTPGFDLQNAGANFTSPLIYNLNILDVRIDNASVDGIPYTPQYVAKVFPNTPGQGRLDFSTGAGGPLSNGAVLCIEVAK